MGQDVYQEGTKQRVRNRHQEAVTVPELDPSAAGSALFLLGAGAFLLRERRRRLRTS